MPENSQAAARPVRVGRSVFHCQHCREWAHAFALMCDELDKQKALIEVARIEIKQSEARYRHLVQTMNTPTPNGAE
jgi:hypothetical protein